VTHPSCTCAPCDRPEAWAETIIEKNWASLKREFGEDLLPVPSARGQKVFKGFMKSCGHYGCVFPTSRKDIVFKITSDPTEAEFIALATLMGDFHPGMVRYYDIARISGAHDGKPVYAIVREACESVGKIKNFADGQKSDELRSFYFSLIECLRAFKDAAKEARAILRSASSTSGLLTQIASPNAGRASTVQILATAVKIVYEVPIPSPAERFVASIKACRALASVMEHNPVGALIGGALRFYTDHGLLLADVHLGNVGLAKRGSRQEWIITDPGHLVRIRVDLPDYEITRAGV